MIKKEILKCNVCGNIAFKLHDGIGTMSCCGEDMQVLTPNTTDGAHEKHVPVVEDSELSKLDPKMKKVKVGSVPHPMEEKHYIEWIASFSTNKATFKWLKPNDKPEANIRLDGDSDVQEYCNIHGLWAKNS